MRPGVRVPPRPVGPFCLARESAVFPGFSALSRGAGSLAFPVFPPHPLRYPLRAPARSAPPSPAGSAAARPVRSCPSTRTRRVREPLFQLRLPRRSQVVEQPRPGLDPILSHPGCLESIRGPRRPSSYRARHYFAAVSPTRIRAPEPAGRVSRSDFRVYPSPSSRTRSFSS